MSLCVIVYVAYSVEIELLEVRLVRRRDVYVMPEKFVKL